MTRSHYRPRLFPCWIYHLRNAAALVFALVVIVYGMGLFLEPIMVTK